MGITGFVAIFPAAKLGAENPVGIPGIAFRTGIPAPGAQFFFANVAFHVDIGFRIVGIDDFVSPLQLLAHTAAVDRATASAGDAPELHQDILGQQLFLIRIHLLRPHHKASALPGDHGVDPLDKVIVQLGAVSKAFLLHPLFTIGANIPVAKLVDLGGVGKVQLIAAHVEELSGEQLANFRNHLFKQFKHRFLAGADRPGAGVLLVIHGAAQLRQRFQQSAAVAGNVKFGDQLQAQHICQRHHLPDLGLGIGVGQPHGFRNAVQTDTQALGIAEMNMQHIHPGLGHEDHFGAELVKPLDTTADVQHHTAVRHRGSVFDLDGGHDTAVIRQPYQLGEGRQGIAQAGIIGIMDPHYTQFRRQTVAFGCQLRIPEGPDSALASHRRHAALGQQQGQQLRRLFRKAVSTERQMQGQFHRAAHGVGQFRSGDHHNTFLL